MDRIEALTITTRTFTQKRGQRLEDLMKQYRDEAKSKSSSPSP